MTTYLTTTELMQSSPPIFILKDVVENLDYDASANSYSLQQQAHSLDKVVVLQLKATALVAADLENPMQFWIPNPASEPVVPAVFNEANEAFYDFTAVIEYVTVDYVAGYIVTVGFPTTPAVDPEPPYELPAADEPLFLYYEAYDTWAGAVIDDGNLDVSACNKALVIGDELTVLYSTNTKPVFNV